METCLSYILQCYKDLRDVKQFSLAMNYSPIEAAKKSKVQSSAQQMLAIFLMIICLFMSCWVNGLLVLKMQHL